jgi:hypothetical protein
MDAVVVAVAFDPEMTARNSFKTGRRSRRQALNCKSSPIIGHVVLVRLHIWPDELRRHSRPERKR